MTHDRRCLVRQMVVPTPGTPIGSATCQSRSPYCKTIIAMLVLHFPRPVSAPVVKRERTLPFMRFS